MNVPASIDRFSVGLTGGIGSGKSTVSAMFGNLGAAVIDTDLIAHQLTSSNGLAIPSIRATFGTEFLLDNGAIDRRKMRETVFADPRKRKQLETILHPLIRSEAERAAVTAKEAYLIFAVPLLVESGAWRERVRRVLVIDCPQDVQIQRVMQRSMLTEAQVRAIMNTQSTRAARLAIADDLIVNDRDETALHEQVHRLHRLYLEAAAG